MKDDTVTIIPPIKASVDLGAVVEHDGVNVWIKQTYKGKPSDSECVALSRSQAVELCKALMGFLTYGVRHD